MQSGNGMTMQEAEQEIKYYQKILFENLDV